MKAIIINIDRRTLYELDRESLKEADVIVDSHKELGRAIREVLSPCFCSVSDAANGFFNV